MFKSSRNAVVSAGLAAVLALGAMGCSAKVETETTTTLSTTDESGTTTTTTTTTESGTSSETTTQTSTTIAMDTWVDAWMGESDTGYQVFFAQAPEGTQQALLALYNPKTSEITSCIGAYNVPEQGTIVVTDAGDGSQFQLTLTSQQTEDGTVSVDLGDTFGKAELKKNEMSAVVDAIKVVDTEHKVIS